MKPFTNRDLINLYRRVLPEAFKEAAETPKELGRAMRQSPFSDKALIDDLVKTFKSDPSTASYRSIMARELNTLRQVPNSWMASIDELNMKPSPGAQGTMSYWAPEVTMSHLNKGMTEPFRGDRTLSLAKGTPNIGRTALHELGHDQIAPRRQFASEARGAAVSHDLVNNLKDMPTTQKVSELPSSKFKAEIDKAWAEVFSKHKSPKIENARLILAHNLGGSTENTYREVEANLWAHMVLGTIEVKPKEWAAVKEVYKPVMDVLNKYVKEWGWTKAVKYGIIPIGALALMQKGFESESEAAGPIQTGSNALRVLRAKNLKGSSTYRELADFKFTEGPYAGKTIMDVHKNPRSKKWYLEFEDGDVASLDKAEAWSMAAELGSRRYVDKFQSKAQDPLAQKVQAEIGLNRKLGMRIPTRREPETEELLRGVGLGDMTSLSDVMVGKRRVQLLTPYANLLDQMGIAKITKEPYVPKSIQEQLR